MPQKKESDQPLASPAWNIISREAGGALLGRVLLHGEVFETRCPSLLVEPVAAAAAWLEGLLGTSTKPCPLHVYLMHLKVWCLLALKGLLLLV